MHEKLKTLLDILQRSEPLGEEERAAIAQVVKDVDNELTITTFKLDRTEKVKRTTAILLEETIDELEQKRKAVEEANAALTKSLEELKATQTQLIHSEKMASLGELTAGIAHEIKNPLNFVNNFSEVSHELLQEMREELANGHYDDAAELAQDVIGNLEKILYHGKRADGIVRGMLQHSRSGSGEKEPTDINALCEEYLRLSYHGLRAKDKSFNAEFNTDFDKTLPKVKVVPQDIGRVLLNLINNAFYACNERSRSANSKQQTENDQQPIAYQPTVTITTQQAEGFIKITVRDNGNGIPHAIMDKLFQPFFTTKPTGQGTGLGLSLSYDIVKAHSGEITVSSSVGEGSEFIVHLPLAQTQDT